MTGSSTPPARTPTEINAIAEAWVDTLVRLEPTVGTYIGRAEADSRFGDLSPAGHEIFLAEVRRTQARLTEAVPVDDVDRVTQLDLGSSLQLAIESSEAGLHLRDLNVIASPSQDIREVFDLMPMETPGDWRVVETRLLAVPGALAGYVETLRQGIAEEIVPARRQVVEVLAQARKNASPAGFFATLPDGAPTESATESLAEAAAVAAGGYAWFADFLESELLPSATPVDAVGREIYALRSRQFLGAAVDLDETYEWGLAELERMTHEQEAIAQEILPGASVHEAIAHLDADDSRKLHGTDALQRWMQETSDRAVDELSRSHFDIPDEIRALECMIAPTDEGGIYYTGPTFDTWRELTTVYHEGVPGHHLQIGQAVYNRATLNTWRRQLAGSSGHAEGWALYAERLMQELGYLDDPADRLGMLDGQRMRAARVVLDIGVHLGKQRPDGAGVWDAEYALEFMRANVNMDDAFIRFEVNRYLGWPGQAPSYKVGQRIWEQLRDDYRLQQGDGYDAKQFHRRALDLGGVGLDTLQRFLLIDDSTPTEGLPS
jgi:uncharacterized protein (DUF885 family)